MAEGFRINRKGYGEALNGDEMFGVCDRIGANMAARLGAGYASDTRKGKTRIHTRVKTVGNTFWKERQSHLLRDTFPGSP